MIDDMPETLTDLMRKHANLPLERIGMFIARLGIHPDVISVVALLLVGMASLFIAAGEFLFGGIFLLLSLPLDAVDGAVARAMQRPGVFGMVLDSTLDRYADGFIFAALSYYFARQDRLEMLGFTLLALVGSYLVSYVRARADDSKVGVSATVGWFTRLERVVVILSMTLATGLLRDPLPLDIGVVVLAVGTNLTALQRLRHVHVALKNRGE